MKRQENDLFQLLKTEADELMFDGMQFNQQMKQRVYQQIRPSRKMDSLAKWFERIHKHWVFTSISTATICGLLLLIPLKQDQPTTMAEHNPTIKIVAPTTTQGNSHLSTLQEAKEWMGNQLSLPSYIPEGFRLKAIQAIGMKNSDTSKLVFTYVSVIEHFYISQISI